MKRNINQRTVKSLKPPAAGNTIIYDNEVRGFGVRITARRRGFFHLELLNFWP